jgi:hypothetical protein
LLVSAFQGNEGVVLSAHNQHEGLDSLHPFTRSVSHPATCELLREAIDQNLPQVEFPPQRPLLLKDCLVDGVWGQGWVKPLEKGDYLFLFGTTKVELMGQLYPKRWTIETCFQAFKERGFDLEKTHLKDLVKLKKLVAFVSIAYSMCMSIGMYIDRKVQKINTKNHAYKANSFCRKGIDTIQEVFRSEQLLPEWMINRMEAPLRWISMQTAHFQLIKMAG